MGGSVSILGTLSALEALELQTPQGRMERRLPSPQARSCPQVRSQLAAAQAGVAAVVPMGAQEGMGALSASLLTKSYSQALSQAMAAMEVRRRVVTVLLLEAEAGTVAQSAYLQALRFSQALSLYQQAAEVLD